MASPRLPQRRAHLGPGIHLRAIAASSASSRHLCAGRYRQRGADGRATSRAHSWYATGPRDAPRRSTMPMVSPYSRTHYLSMPGRGRECCISVGNSRSAVRTRAPLLVRRSRRLALQHQRHAARLAGEALRVRVFDRVHLPSLRRCSGGDRCCIACGARGGRGKPPPSRRWLSSAVRSGP